LLCALYLSPYEVKQMSTGIWAAASGMVSQTAALDVAATNIANASTPGFRADRALFRQTMAQATDRSMGTQSLRYSVSRTVQPNMAAGQMVETGRGLDVAIRNENSFFAVRTPEGERYTRAGSFHLTADGKLTTADGLPVLDSGRQPITVPTTGQAITIDPTGQILADGEPAGPKLLVVSFNKPDALEKQGSNLLRGTPGAGRPTSIEAELNGGYLELSNSSAIDGMTHLISATREFEMLARVVEAFSSTEHKAATQIAGSR
jgi:flagellar basal-body rod protein FlgF